MKIGLIGYGKLNKAIEELALQQGHSICFKADSKTPKENWKAQLHQVDIVIENTHPLAVEDNLLICFEAGIPVVTGTTGWHHRFEQVSQACVRHNAALFYSSNFSLGVFITNQLNRYLANIMSQQPEYSAKLQEWHHVHKKDAPSGTALSLAEGIFENHSGYKDWDLEKSNQEGTLEIKSYRQGEITGKHQIEWISDNDAIRIEHEAFNRNGFASGALLASSFLMNKKGIYTMKHLFSTFELWK